MVISRELNVLLTLPFVAQINSIYSKYRELISIAFTEQIPVWLYNRPLALREQITDSQTIDRQYTRLLYLSRKPLTKVHANLYSGSRGFNVGLSLHLHPHFVYASNRGYQTFFRLNSTGHDISSDHKNVMAKT